MAASVLQFLWRGKSVSFTVTIDSAISAARHAYFCCILKAEDSDIVTKLTSTVMVASVFQFFVTKVSSRKLLTRGE